MNKGAVAGFLPTMELNLRTEMGVQPVNYYTIACICKLHANTFTDLCSEMCWVYVVIRNIRKYRKIYCTTLEGYIFEAFTNKLTHEFHCCKCF